MLALSPYVGYIPEPFGLHHRPGQFAAQFPWWFPYVNSENEAPYVRPVSDMLAFRYSMSREAKAVRSLRDGGRLLRDSLHFARYRRTRARPLLKDPLAVFSAEWLASRFGVQPLILIRHPAAFASSLKKLGWNHPFGHFLAQPLLMRDFLEPFRSRIEAFAAKEQPIVDQAILLWQIIHRTVLDYRLRYPNWLFVRHEDLSRRPVEEFRKLYNQLNLPFDNIVERRIQEHSAETNPVESFDPLNVRRSSKENIWKWRQFLSSDEIDKIRREVGSMSQEFYSDQDWAPDRQPISRYA